MDTYFYELRELTRQHQSLQELKTSINNQLHAAGLGMYPNKLVIRQLKNLIATIEKQLVAVDAAIEQHIRSKAEVAEKVMGTCKIKGLGINTVAVILAETNGFALFKNSRQLVSYAGYDVVENQSGMHYGRTRISKKGNSRIRRSLHLPAFNMIRYEQRPFVQLYERTLERHGRKMKSYVAVQKKLLTVVYGLWKHGIAYDPVYNLDETAGERELKSSSLPGPEAGTTQNKNSASPKVTLHKVDLPSKTSPLVSSLQLQN
jgi:transposase